MTKKKIENFKKISNFYFNKYSNLIKCEDIRLDLIIFFERKKDKTL